jgi:hypothetical protein
LICEELAENAVIESLPFRQFPLLSF